MIIMTSYRTSMKVIPFRKTNCDIKFVEDGFWLPYYPNFHFLFICFLNIHTKNFNRKFIQETFLQLSAVRF